MDDVVKAAVRAAMAHESKIAYGSEAAAPAPAAATEPGAAGDAPNRKTDRRHKVVTGAVGEKRELGKEERDLKEKSTAGGQLKGGGDAPGTPAAAAPPASPGQARAGGGGGVAKKLSSNWAALRKTLPKPSPGVVKRRPRKLPAAAPPAPAPAAPLNCSMFVRSALRSGPAVKPTKVVALDCEFVGVGPEGRENALARASLVNSRGEVLYDSFVRVELPVVDYRTQYSGVRPEDIAGPGAADPRRARSEIAALLKGRVLVGHAVGNDLRVLRIPHPQRDIRDTSDYYKRLWKRDGRRGGAPPALRLVVARVLGVDQFQTAEHDSCEDARAALALYKKNAKVWETSKRASSAKTK
jgi:RNA exonuclease 4